MSTTGAASADAASATSLSQSPAPRNVLIVLPRQLGDILLGLPLAHALKSRFPDLRISWYAHPMGRLLLRDHPWVDALLCYPVPPRPKAGEHWSPWRRVRETLRHVWAEIRFVRALRAQRFDAVVDAMSNPRTALTAWLTGAPLRVSFRSRFPRTLAFTHLVARERLARGYVAAARLALLEPWGLDEFSDVSALLPCDPAERVRVETFLKEQALEDGRFVVCAPAHRHPVRKWPGASFVQLARLLWERHGVRTVWLWGPGEDAEIGALQRALDEAVGRGPASSRSAGIVPPLLTLRETAALAGHSLCFVGNSNGLSHVSVAGGARSVQIHGPTNPENWTLPDPARHAGVQRDAGCVRCERNTCALARRECLDDLTVETVLAAVERIAGL